MTWPEWWSWDLELSPHLFKRMLDRGFNEVDLRVMLENATGYHQNHEPGRWAIDTARNGAPWEVIVEPIDAEEILVVLTAYEVDR